MIYAGEERVKKRAVLNGPCYFTGTETLGAYMELTGLPASNIHFHALNVDKPAAPRMTVGVAYGISCYRPAAAAVTEFRHLFPPLSALKQSTCTLYHSIVETCNNEGVLIFSKEKH